MKGCRPLTDAEVDLTLQTLRGRFAARDRALFLLGVKSGFRISELLSLRVADVWQAGRLVDRVTVSRRHMKKRLEGRTVLLHPAAKAALRIWLDQLHAGRVLPADAVVFQSRKGTNQAVSRTHAYRLLRAAYTANRFTGKLGTHSMRKTFATKVYDALQHDLVQTQRALGHRNINSTAQYLSFREEDIDRAILTL